VKRWEYTYVFSDWERNPDQTLRDLNHMGREGWEVCGVQPDNVENMGVILMKRELPAQEVKS
jgi:hypothetical protein